MVGIGVGSGVGSASGDVSQAFEGPLWGQVPPPPKRGRSGTLKAGVAQGFPLEPLAGSSSRDGGEGATRVVCNDERGSSVRWLHGGGLEVPK